MLYRVNENAIVVCHRGGEVVVQLQKIFRVPVAGYSMYFVHAKSFQSLGFNDNVGHLVQEGNQISVFRVENISRKVILAKDDDVAGRPSYLVVDYLTPGTVVVPYCPCINDMVFVRGDDEDTTRRARVLDFNIRRHSCGYQKVLEINYV